MASFSGKTTGAMTFFDIKTAVSDLFWYRACLAGAAPCCDGAGPSFSSCFLWAGTAQLYVLAWGGMHR